MMIRTTSSSSSSSSSPKSKNGEELDTEKLKKKMELVSEPHLSGAYIRNLVKELTSSSTTNPTKTSDRKLISGAQDGFPETQEKSHQERRKVRRRVQSRKPYQEGLLNMTEARREIVSALKLHREAMKQKQQMKSGPEFQPIEPGSHQFCSEQEASNSSNCNNFFYSRPVFSISQPSLVQENLDFVLPRQTLGLNLNLHDFYNLDTSPSSIYSSSSASCSSCPLLSSAAEEIGHTAAEAVEFEWSDSLQLVNSKGEKDEDFVSSPFDQVMEFPGWLNANESYLEHVDDLWFNDYFRDYDLPCMDIEEIEGMDGNWLA